MSCFGAAQRGQIMFSVIAFVATAIGIIVGVVELRRYSRESDEDRETISLLLKATIVIALVAYGVYFFYLGPSGVGHAYVDAVRRMDTQTLYDKSCEGSALRLALGGIGGSIISFGGMFGEGASRSEMFIPFANQYRFDWTMVSFVEDEWHSAKLDIRPDGPFSFCVSNAEGL